MTVWVADGHAPVQRLVSVVKTATVLEKCITEEQCLVVPFLRAKGLNAEDIHKEMFAIDKRKCLSRKTVPLYMETFR
jgi:hypothetical protein